MEWEEPRFAEICLACEVSSYANAELDDARASDSISGRESRGADAIVACALS